jgi:type I restriction enzyme S subunit
MNISVKGEIDLTDLKYVESEDYDCLLKGDVLFNNTNSPELLGKTALVKQDSNWAYSNHMTRIRLNVNLLNPAWVSNCLHTLFFDGFFRAHCVHHVNQASIGSSFLTEKVVIPLPPLPEQRRIVAKIEELFAKLDAGVAALKKVKAQLKRYRQAVLKHAFEGKLTAAWREAHNDELEPASVLLERIKKERGENAIAGVRASHPVPPERIRRGDRPVAPTGVDRSDLPELPEGWVWTRIGEITEKMQYGTSEKADEDASDIPVLRMGNIQDGRLVFENLKFYPRDWPQLEEFILQDGDVLFNRTNSAELVGKTAVYKGSHQKAVFASYLIRIRVNKGAYDPDMLSSFVNSFYGRRYITSVVSQQVGQANVNGTKLSLMPIPLPPLAEQHKIVEEIERRFSIADEAERVVEQSLKQAERLRQSILKRAFAGKLVPQDPTDEPAEELLKRIREAKKRYEPEKHHRRSIRLKDYDYSQAGAYFITICTQDRQCLLGEVVNGEMQLNEMGKIVADEWKRSVEIRQEIALDEFVVMPNHIHGIVEIKQSNVGATGRSPLPRGPARKSLGAFVAGFKSAVAKRINETRGTPGASVWQRNYYEHVVRNEDDLGRIREYIVSNPLKWEWDEENPDNIRQGRLT